MKKNGFTLIELVVVIVILGILAVTAAPRFLNLQVDARNSALEGLKGAVETGLETGFGKLAIVGLESQSYITSKDTNSNKGVSIPIQGCESNSHQLCIFKYGYPEGGYYTMTTLVDGINKHYEQEKDWNITRKDGAMIITDKENLDYPTVEGKEPTLKNNNCYLRYFDATDKNKSYRLEIVPCQ
ncbi:type II secretion system protein [Photobacterium rosenbergii]|uniref:Type II secretion system protein n=1 Tax=Photobacterium rosenbergii TaxID=294936 RepID=A0A2T3NH70_9GAMM|nr:type II secretion system protein [Photobacterium rosenbergii]PSW14366.1 type II secretion system protein [Photobacterium rosenbergii]